MVTPVGDLIGEFRTDEDCAKGKPVFQSDWRQGSIDAIGRAILVGVGARKRSIPVVGGFDLAAIKPPLRFDRAWRQHALIAGAVTGSLKVGCLSQALLPRHGDADSFLWRDQVIGAHSVLLDGQLHAFDAAVELITARTVVR
jgi:hypothetical protein